MELHNFCKTTHFVWYQNWFLSSPLWKILHLTEIFYTTSGCDGCDKYEVWSYIWYMNRWVTMYVPKTWCWDLTIRKPVNETKFEKGKMISGEMFKIWIVYWSVGTRGQKSKSSCSLPFLNRAGWFTNNFNLIDWLLAWLAPFTLFYCFFHFLRLVVESLRVIII